LLLSQFLFSPLWNSSSWPSSLSRLDFVLLVFHLSFASYSLHCSSSALIIFVFRFT
jgi:hypothetical protein